MFENVIGQRETIRTLTADLAGGAFPRASLFFGPPYSGKLTAALETARVLTCRQGTGAWTCECTSCRMQKELAHPHTVLLGYRYADIEIAASADALIRNPKPPTQFLFLRAVRKLLRRYDALVWDAEDARMKSAQEKVSQIEELLADVAPGRPLPGVDNRGGSTRSVALEKALQAIIEASMDLAAVVKNDHITIGQVRKLSTWAHLTTADSLKVAVVENADRMQESARNALLKLLEEPPEGVRLILLSTRRSAIIPTVLSRLRPYSFLQRSREEEREVLSKIFRDETGRYFGLRAFFLAWKEINSEELARICRSFMERVTERDGPSVDILKEMRDLFPGIGQRDREAVMSFLEELTFFLQCALRQRSADLDTLEGWNRSIREAQARIELYNMNPQATVESLFLQMRAVFSAGGSPSFIPGAAARETAATAERSGSRGSGA
jgi:DNA polymerase III delta prime subunit